MRTIILLEYENRQDGPIDSNPWIKFVAAATEYFRLVTDLNLSEKSSAVSIRVAFESPFIVNSFSHQSLSDVRLGFRGLTVGGSCQNIERMAFNIIKEESGPCLVLVLCTKQLSFENIGCQVESSQSLIVGVTCCPINSIKKPFFKEQRLPNGIYYQQHCLSLCDLPEYMSDLCCFLNHFDKIEICEIPMKKKSEKEKKLYSVKAVYKNLESCVSVESMDDGSLHFQVPLYRVKWGKRMPRADCYSLASAMSLLNLDEAPTMVVIEALLSNSSYFFASLEPSLGPSYFICLQNSNQLMLYKQAKFRLSMNEEIAFSNLEQNIPVQEYFEEKLLDATTRSIDPTFFNDILKEFTLYLPFLRSSTVLFDRSNILSKRLLEILLQLINSKTFSDSSFDLFKSILENVLLLAKRNDQVMFPNESFEDRLAKYNILFDELNELTLALPENILKKLLCQVLQEYLKYSESLGENVKNEMEVYGPYLTVKKDKSNQDYSSSFKDKSIKRKFEMDCLKDAHGNSSSLE